MITARLAARMSYARRFEITMLRRRSCGDRCYLAWNCYFDFHIIGCVASIDYSGKRPKASTLFGEDLSDVTHSRVLTFILQYRFVVLQPVLIT
jgi:hypothetical protein